MDFWENNFSKDAEEVVDKTMPVLVTIFNTRLRLLETYLDEQEAPECQQVIADLRAQIAQLPTEFVHRQARAAGDRRSLAGCLLELSGAQQARIPAS